MANSKVRFGLKNVHYAVVTETLGEDGKITTSYGAVKAWPGAVNLDLSAEGSVDNFYADDYAYYTLSANNGYTGSFESALIPEDVYINVFGQTKTSDGLVTESTDDEIKYIALMFEVDGDADKRRNVFYRCALARPNAGSNTVEESKEVQTQTVDITVTARPDDGKVKAYCDADASAYAGFFSAVPVAPVG